MPPGPNPAADDRRLRLFVYRHILAKAAFPTVAQMATSLRRTTKSICSGLARLSESHAFMTQENRELWRAAPFSAIPTPFPVRLGQRSWYGNCIWDALGIPVVLGQNAHIGAACGCCNYDMPVEVKDGKLASGKGIIHIAVPARDWYKDVVFT
jgi:hypothetical protein